MISRWIRYFLVAIVGLALGVSGTRLLDGRPSASNTKKASEPDVPRRKSVRSRSTTLAIDQLQALGYVDGSHDENSDLANVVEHHPEKTHPGYNFYTSRQQRGARLIDMDGIEVHAWKTEDPGHWQHAELLPTGDVIVVVKDERLTRYDKDSNRVWTVEGRFHHDLWIEGDEIYAIARSARVISDIHEQTPISKLHPDLVAGRRAAA